MYQLRWFSFIICGVNFVRKFVAYLLMEILTTIVRMNEQLITHTHARNAPRLPFKTMGEMKTRQSSCRQHLLRVCVAKHRCCHLHCHIMVDSFIRHKNDFSKPTHHVMTETTFLRNKITLPRDFWLLYQRVASMMALMTSNFCIDHQMKFTGIFSFEGANVSYELGAFHRNERFTIRTLTTLQFRSAWQKKWGEKNLF